MRNVETAPVLDRPTVPIQKTIVMPLAQVPEPKNRVYLSSELLNTSGHELNHAIVALESGVPVISISVISDGNSLGRTAFSGLLSPDTMKIIAAAGSVTTHDGCAYGYGSDLSKVDMLGHFYGGITRESATSYASAIISKYSTKVRRKAAEIIAYLGEISGSMLPTVLLRAQMEVNLEKGIIDGQFIIPKTNTIEANKPKHYTVIDYLRNGDYKITYFVGERQEKEELICAICKGINDHLKSCPKHDKERTIPQESTIFPRLRR